MLKIACVQLCLELTSKAATDYWVCDCECFPVGLVVIYMAVHSAGNACEALGGDGLLHETLEHRKLKTAANHKQL